MLVASVVISFKKTLKKRDKNVNKRNCLKMFQGFGYFAINLLRNKKINK